VITMLADGASRRRRHDRTTVVCRSSVQVPYGLDETAGLNGRPVSPISRADTAWHSSSSGVRSSGAGERGDWSYLQRRRQVAAAGRAICDGLAGGRCGWTASATAAGLSSTLNNWLVVLVEAMPNAHIPRSAWPRVHCSSSHRCGQLASAYAITRATAMINGDFVTGLPATPRGEATPNCGKGCPPVRSGIGSERSVARWLQPSSMVMATTMWHRPLLRIEMSITGREPVLELLMTTSCKRWARALADARHDATIRNRMRAKSPRSTDWNWLRAGVLGATDGICPTTAGPGAGLGAVCGPTAYLSKSLRP